MRLPQWHQWRHIYSHWVHGERKEDLWLDLELLMTKAPKQQQAAHRCLHAPDLHAPREGGGGGGRTTERLAVRKNSASSLRQLRRCRTNMKTQANRPYSTTNTEHTV